MIIDHWWHPLVNTWVNVGDATGCLSTILVKLQDGFSCIALGTRAAFLLHPVGKCAMMNMCDDDMHFCNQGYRIILKCLSSGIQAAGLHYACAVLHQLLL